MAGKKKQTLHPIVDAAIAELMDDPELYDLARETIDYSHDARYSSLNLKEAYYTGEQYSDRPYDWSGALVNGKALGLMRETHGFLPEQDETPPTCMRKPSTQYKLAKVVVNRFTSLLMGEKQFPSVVVKKNLDTQLWCNKVMEQALFQAHFSEGAALGGRVGSVIVMFKVVDGKFELECFNSKYANIVWQNFTAGKMQAFCISYPFTKQVYNTENQRWETKLFLYRRMVTENFDIEFFPQELVASMGRYRLKNEGDSLPEPNPKKTVQHNLGRCPARFIQNLPSYDNVDGDCSYEGLFDKIDRINENLSAINSAMQSNLDPTLVLKMTPDDYRRLEETGGPIKTGNDGYAVVVGDKGDAKYIEVTCANLTVAMTINDKLREWALEEADCIIADPHKISGAAQSDSAISKLYTPMLAKLGLMRTQYGKRGIRMLLGDMIQAYHKLTAVRVTAEEGVVKPFLKPVEVVDPQTEQIRTVSPLDNIDADDIDLAWGRYFEPSANDVFQITEAAVMATGGRPITTQKQAAHAVAEYYGDPAVETTVAALDKQAAEEAKLAKEAAQVGVTAQPDRTGTHTGSRPSKQTAASVKT